MAGLDNFTVRQLDRLVTLSINHNFRNVEGQTMFDTATRKVWARRINVRATDQLAALVFGQELTTTSRWELRAGGDPPLSIGQSRIVDDEGTTWFVKGIQPIGRRNRLEVLCVISDG